MLAGGPGAASADRRRRRALEDPRLERPRDRGPLRRRRRRRRARARRGRRLPRLRARRGRLGRAAALPARRRLATPATAESVAERLHFVQMNGREVFKFATRVLVSLGRGRARPSAALTIDDVDVYVPHQANVRIIEHARREARDSGGEDGHRRRPLRQHVVGLDSARAGRREGRRPAVEKGKLVLMTGMGAGLTWGSGLIEWTDGGMAMSRQKIAFCFPGQGSLEPRAWAARSPRRCPRRWRSTARRARPRASISSGSASRRPRGAGRRPRCSSRRSSRRAWPCSRRSARDGYRAGLRRRPLGRRVRGACRRASAVGRARRSRSSASAAWRWPRRPREHPGSMAAILGLEDEVVEDLCKQIARRLAGELQLPGPDRHLRREPGRRRVLRRGRAARARAGR